jgi:hypothetical protein
MRKLFVMVAVTVATAAVIGSTAVSAAPAYSWNLSRAMMSNFGTNPLNGGGPWSAMYDAVGSTLNPANFQMMPTLATNWLGQPHDAWTFPASHSLSVSVPTGPLPMGSNPVVAKGMPMLHPGPGKSSVVRWKSPLNGSVHVLARISDANAGCGNGIMWNILRDNASVAAGTLPDGHNGTVVHLQVPVTAFTAAHPGTSIYFVVSPNGNDHQCDSTILDVLIAGQ